MAKNNQAELATSLLETLNEYDEDGGMSLADLLDNLASAGLKLAVDTNGEASEAYIKLLSEDLISAE